MGLLSGNVYFNFNEKRFGKVNLEDYKFSEGMFFEKEEIETLKFAIRYFHNYYICSNIYCERRDKLEKIMDKLDMKY